MKKWLSIALSAALTGPASAGVDKSGSTAQTDSRFMTLGNPGAPIAEKSKYLATEQGGFLANADGAGVSYEVVFSVRNPVAQPLYVTLVFENPAERSSPWRLDRVIDPEAKTLSASSPPIRRLRNAKNYRVEVLIYADAQRGHLIDRLEQKIVFRIPPDSARSMGVELIK